MIAIGNGLGLKPLTEKLNWIRFFFHGTFISLLLPVYWTIGQAQGIDAFESSIMMIVIAALTIVIGVMGFLTGFKKVNFIVPTNYFGCLRYAQKVSEETAIPNYTYEQAHWDAKVMPPLAAILTTLINLVLAIWIAVAASFWIPLIATAIMFTAASFPFGRWGAIVTSVIEVFYSSMMLYALYLCL